MATITVPARTLPGTRYDHRFIPAMAVVLSAVMVAGFAHTYFFVGLFRAPLPGPLIHMRGAVLASGLYCSFTAPGAIGLRCFRPRRHSS